MIIVIINKRKLNKENVNVFESLYFFFIQSHNYSNQRMRGGRASCFWQSDSKAKFHITKSIFHNNFYIFLNISSHIFVSYQNQTCTMYFRGNITKNNQVSNAARKSHMTTRTSTHDLKQKQTKTNKQKVSTSGQA